MNTPTRFLLVLGTLMATRAASADPTVIAHPTAASTPVRAARGVSSPKTSTLQQLTDSILKETSIVRQLPVLRPVHCGTRSEADFKKMLQKSVASPKARRKLAATDVLIHKLGLAPASFKVEPLMIKLLSEQIAGYYDSGAKQFYVTGATNAQNPSELEIVLAHELTHALQDQHFGLARLEHWPEGDSDAEMAAHALVEGDATFTQNRYLMRHPMNMVGLLFTAMGMRTRSHEFAAAPRFVRESITFPYLQGAVWVTALHRRGGWAAVSRAHRELPQSTAQILHPDLYFKHVAPVKMALPDIARELGHGWKRIDYDVNGEFGYYQIFDAFESTSPEARPVAATWRGDRYALYQGPHPGDVVLEQVVTLNSPTAARAFMQAYDRRTYQRYSNLQLESRPEHANDSRRVYTSKEGAVILACRGACVYLLEGVRALPLALKLAARPAWNTQPNRKPL